LPGLSFAKEVDASYAVAADKTTVVINSKSRVNSRGVYVGTGQMTFHWESSRWGSSWKCELSMLDPVAVQAAETAGEDGSQKMEVELRNVFPACLLLVPGGGNGALTAPAVHVDVPWGGDIWVFLLRSPWFPLKFQVDRSVLSLQHDASKVTALLGVSFDGSLTAQVALEGTGFKKAALDVRRTIGSFSSYEVIGEVEGGIQSFKWSPTTPAFDLLLITKGKISSKEDSELVRRLGVEAAHHRVRPMSWAEPREGMLVFCDGPAISYELILRGQRGLLENQDKTSAKFTW